MRIRSVKPEFWSHPMHGKISESAALLALASLSYADDEGRFKLEFVGMKAALFTYRALAVPLEEAFKELVAVRWFQVYEAVFEGEKIPFCQVVTFRRHQYINKRVPSRFPAPPVALPEQSGSPPVALPEQSGSPTALVVAGLDRIGGDRNGEEGMGDARADRGVRDFQPPKLEEVLMVASMRAVPDDCARAWFHDRASVNWIFKHEEITDWRQNLQGFAVRWRGIEEKNRSSRKSGAAPGSVAAQMAERDRLRALEKMLLTHPANQESTSYREDCTALDRKNLTALRGQIEALTRQVAGRAA